MVWSHTSGNEYTFYWILWIRKFFETFWRDRMIQLHWVFNFSYKGDLMIDMFGFMVTGHWGRYLDFKNRGFRGVPKKGASWLFLCTLVQTFHEINQIFHHCRGSNPRTLNARSVTVILIFQLFSVCKLKNSVQFFVENTDQELYWQH